MGRRAGRCWAPLCAALLMLCASASAIELRPHAERSAARLVAEGNEALVQGHFERAQAAYQQALEVDARNFHALFNLGLAWQAQERWDQARRRFEEALLVRPEHAQTMCNLGIIAFTTGEYAEAAARFSTAAQLASSNPAEAADYLFNVGTAREALRQWSEARDAYRAASELDPNHFAALYNLGTLHMGRHLRQPANAERYLKLAMRVAPERPEPLLNLGILMESLGRGEEAEVHFNRAVDLARERQPSLLNTALWRRARFQHDRQPPQRVAMRRDLEDLLRRDPDFPGANGMLGRHYLALGDVDQAIPLLEREVNDANFDADDAGDVDTIYLLARIYNDERPNARKAMEYATRFYRLRPDSPRERELRRRLRQMNQGPMGSASDDGERPAP